MNLGTMKHISYCAVVVAVAACTPDEDARVHVTYEQVAQFGSYRLSSDSSGSTGAEPDGIYILYRIGKIDNSGAQAKPFVFEAQSLSVFTDGHFINEDPGAENILLGSEFASPIAVDAGQILQQPQQADGLGCVIKIVRAKDPTTLLGAQIDLLYNIDADQPVSLTRINGNVPEATVLGDALPSTLQMLCNNIL